MKHRILIKQQLWMNFILGVILVTAIVFSILRYHKLEQEYYYNQARLMVADMMKEIEQGFYRESKYPYGIFDLRGKVVYASDGLEISIGDAISLSETLQFDHSFDVQNKNIMKVSFVINNDGIVDHFAVIYLPKSDVSQYVGVNRVIYIFLPIIIATIIILLFLMIRSINLKHTMIKPIEEISQSAKAIIEGNYNIPVIKSEGKRLLHSEVDDLSYSFELMRDELKERILREETLKRSQKELISCISHDLRTPITTIKAYSEGLRDGLAKEEEKRIRYAQIIAEKADLVTKMLGDLLEHSNAELNELKIMKAECYIRDYLFEVVKELKLYLEQKGVTLKFNHEVPNLLVNMDGQRIHQVLYNLIENSLKYMDKPEGWIEISVNYLKEQQMISFQVKDNGSGISMTDIPYVFDKFYRAEKSRNLSIPGSGLGLSICKYIVEKHGGNISCHSKQDVGTEFTFTIALS
ncbi:MAG: hypothetical protein K0S47_368 [Herbinix sp.]|jgi:signal transduction histidine kinase|nr:hypothetical protein [Herbinix sp.]